MVIFEEEYEESSCLAIAFTPSVFKRNHEITQDFHENQTRILWKSVKICGFVSDCSWSQGKAWKRREGLATLATTATKRRESHRGENRPSE